MTGSHQHFADFLRERVYLKNVSPKTRPWYETAWKTFQREHPKTGGDVVHLSRILRHSEIGTTMKYLHLLAEDLQKPHQSLSILNRLR